MRRTPFMWFLGAIILLITISGAAAINQTYGICADYIMNATNNGSDRSPYRRHLASLGGQSPNSFTTDINGTANGAWQAFFGDYWTNSTTSLLSCGIAGGSMTMTVLFVGRVNTTGGGVENVVYLGTNAGGNWFIDEVTAVGVDFRAGHGWAGGSCYSSSLSAPNRGAHYVQDNSSNATPNIAIFNASSTPGSYMSLAKDYETCGANARDLANGIAIGGSDTGASKLTAGIVDRVVILNYTANESVIRFFEAMGDQYGGLGGGGGGTDFTITAVSATDGSAISTFNASLNGTSYGTTTGTITTALDQGNDLINITLWGVANFSNRTYTNWNYSGNLEGNLTEFVNITARTTGSNESITFNLTANNNTHVYKVNATTQARLPLTGNWSLNISSDTYFNVSGYFNISSGQKIIRGMYNVYLTVYAREWITNASLSIFNASTNGTAANTTTNGSLVLLLQAGGHNLSGIAPGYWRNDTMRSYTGLTTPNYTIELRSSRVRVSVTDRITGLPVNNFTATFQSLNYSVSHTASTTAGNVTFDLINGTWNITVDPSEYLQNWSTFSVNASAHNFTFNLYQTNSINITFLHEINLTRMDMVNISITLIGENAGYSYNTTNGTLFKALITPDTYQIRYDASDYGYAERFYRFQLTNRSYTQLTLYMIEASSVQNVTITLTDQSGSLLEGAEIRALRYQQATNTYNHVETAITNFLGQGTLQMQLNREFYRFQVYYPNTTALVFTSIPLYITSTSMNLQVIVGTLAGTPWYRQAGVDYTLNYTNSTKNFNFQYSDSVATTTEGCLEVYTVQVSGLIPLNSSCATGAAGTVLLNAPEVNGTTYLARAYVTYDGTKHYLDTMYKAFPERLGSGTTGLFFVVLLMMACAGIGAWRPSVGVLLASFVPMMASAMHLLEIPIAATVPIFVLGVIIALILGRGGAAA